MKTVSDEYKLHMRDIIRAQSHARISVTKDDDIFTFESDVILSINQTDDVDPLSRRLPVETVVFSIIDLNDMYNPHSPSSVWECLDSKTNVSVQMGYTVNGTIEWLQWDQYLLDGKPTSDNGVATFRASRKLAHLTGTYYKGKCEFLPSITLDYEARQVFEDAGISSGYYEIDASLMNKYSVAALPTASHAECLQLIAHAAGCRLYTKPNGVISIEAFTIPTTSNGFVLTRQLIARNKETTTKTPPVSTISTKQYIYSLATETPEVIAQYSVDGNGTETVHVEYDLTYSPSISTSAGTLSNVHLYGRAADFTLTSNGAAIVTISGIRVNVGAKTVTSTLSNSGEPDVEDNIMINFAHEHNQLFGVYLSYRLSHQISYRGNPELQCGDAIYYETPFGTLALVLVLSTQIVFNGAISGTLILKNLANYTETELYDSYDELVIDKNDEQIQVTDSEPYYSDYSMDEMDDFIEEVLG